MSLIAGTSFTSPMATVTQGITLWDVVGMAEIAVNQPAWMHCTLAERASTLVAKIHRPVRIPEGVLRERLRPRCVVNQVNFSDLYGTYGVRAPVSPS